MFYIAYALGQCAVEVGALIFAAQFISHRFHRRVHSIFVVLTFFLLLIHVIDFPLIRITGMTIWGALDFVKLESFENFIELLYATHTSLFSWIIAGAIALLLPILGILFYRTTEKLSRKKPIRFSYSIYGASLFAILVLFSIFDLKGFREEEKQLLVALPWKSTLLPANQPKLKVGFLNGDLPEKKYLSMLEETVVAPAKRPNIFLFIVESLREDFLTPEVTPHLAGFKNDNLSFPHGIAAANGTHLSWFSIFHSVYPFYWDTRSPSQWQSGSLPLQILKKAGYQIHVYSSSRLGYYQMDQRLFGKDHSLVDTFKAFGQDEEKENYLYDTECITTLLQDMASYEEGHVCIVFLESTHFGYSWPKEESHTAAPATMDYLKLTCSNDEIQNVKSRYQNAIHFIDTLFGRFMGQLDSHPTGKKSVVVVTGDHGEEFFEEGRLFHASNLSPMQIHVPIYYRLGKKNYVNPIHGELSSHLDIFPTVLNHVLGKNYFVD
ncbi:MAG TPA: sulfatase-like hydrolase/transferase, partial [Candidatus Babeliaceae bacterium]|nr:sulfatase-like hydrolase/transferase [Candidatus Babeliaceae bacterium]